MSGPHDRVARLVAANTPEQLARAYLKARARAETAEQKLEGMRAGTADKSTRDNTAFSDGRVEIDVSGNPGMDDILDGIRDALGRTS